MVPGVPAWGRFSKETVASASTSCPGEISSSPEARQISSSPYVPGTMQVAVPALESEQVNLSESSTAVHRPFKMSTWNSSSPLSQPQSPLIFTAGSYGELLFPAQEPWGGEPCVELGLLVPQGRHLC